MFSIRGIDVKVHLTFVLILIWAAYRWGISLGHGVEIVLFPKGIVRMFLFMGPLTRIRRVPALLYIGFWFVTQFFNGVGSLGVATTETGGVAYWAHIGGFVAGLGLAWLYKRVLDRPQWPEEAQRAVR